MWIVFLFVVLIPSMLFAIKPTKLNKSYSRICEKHDESFINFTKGFGFTG